MRTKTTANRGQARLLARYQVDPPLRCQQMFRRFHRVSTASNILLGIAEGFVDTNWFVATAGPQSLALPRTYLWALGPLPQWWLSRRVAEWQLWSKSGRAPTVRNAPIGGGGVICDLRHDQRVDSVVAQGGAVINDLMLLSRRRWAATGGLRWQGCIISYAQSLTQRQSALADRKITACIPSRPNRKVLIPHDPVLYKKRHKSKTCSENSRTGVAFTPDTTAAPTPSSQAYV